MRDVINISLPARMARDIKKEVKKGGFASMSEFMRVLIRQWQEEQFAEEMLKREKEMREGKMDAWYLYILLCRGNKLYAGIAKDVEERFRLHKLGHGAKYTQRNKPRKIVYTEKFASMSEARRREEQIKKFTRAQKEKLIEKSL